MPVPQANTPAVAFRLGRAVHPALHCTSIPRQKKNASKQTGQQLSPTQPKRTGQSYKWAPKATKKRVCGTCVGAQVARQRTEARDQQPRPLHSWNDTLGRSGEAAQQ